MKKLSVVFGLISLLILTTACIKSTPGEDSWLCDNGTWVKHGNPSIPAPAESECQAEILYEEKAEEMDAKIFSPLPNDTIKSPLEITGEAKGLWFFEGSFPVKLVDSKGNVLVQGQAQAQGEWMTENLVPFTASLKFDKPETEVGLLIFSKDNPSGMPENEKSISIPVKFTDILSSGETPQEYMTIQVFMGSSQLDPDSIYCEKSYPITRVIPKTKAVAEAAITELLKGISMEEEDKGGYFTSLNAGIKMQKLSITNGTAYIDFNQALQDKVGGSCLTSRIRSQITQTLKQFPSIKNVVISIDGNSETILQP